MKQTVCEQTVQKNDTLLWACMHHSAPAFVLQPHSVRCKMNGKVNAFSTVTVGRVEYDPDTIVVIIYTMKRGYDTS